MSKENYYSIFEFQKDFETEEECLSYLCKKKWSTGYTCLKCGHDKYCRAVKQYDRQCTSCHYIESPTSNTLFHQIKFPLVKAFYIVYWLSTSKKGISTTELSRKLKLRQKTAWLFKIKVMKAMESSNKYPLKGKVEVDESVVGGQEEGVVGRKNDKKSLVVFAIEKKGSGISRMYGKVINHASEKEIGGFMKDKIEKDAKIKADGWRSYQPLKKHFTYLQQENSSKKASNFPLMHRAIMMFKAWLRGIHHHAEYLQSYINEYCYRFNRSFMKGDIFENLMSRMVEGGKCNYKMLRTEYYVCA